MTRPVVYRERASGVWSVWLPNGQTVPAASWRAARAFALLWSTLHAREA